MNVRLLLIWAAAILSAQVPWQAIATETGQDMPLFEMEGVEVVHSETDFRPEFSREVPNFSFYEQPELPRGELILALEFMDRYRDNVVPGSVKWAGLLHFPVIDGRGRTYLKFICLYYYNDRMFGYDPTARYDSERRFAIPIQYENRTNPDVLYRFAESYVASIFPADQDFFYLQEFYDPEDPSAGYEEIMEYIDIPGGRIAPVLPSDKGKTKQELVQLIYRFSLTPNPDQRAEASFGPGEDFGKLPDFSWAGFWEGLKTIPDPIRTARALVAPRWSRIAEYRYPKKILLLWEMEAQERVLLFNIGQRIYAYDERFGVWRTAATLEDVAGEGNSLSGKLRYPGIKALPEIVFLEDGSEVGKGNP